MLICRNEAVINNVGAIAALSAREAAAAKRLDVLAAREAAKAGVSWVLS
jgi:hypothetical protein